MGSRGPLFRYTSEMVQVKKTSAGSSLNEVVLLPVAEAEVVSKVHQSTAVVLQ